MKSIDLNKIVISDNILSLIPKTVAKRLNVLPVYMKGSTLVVALDNEDYHIVDQVEMITSLPIETIVIDDPDSLMKAINRYYPELKSGNNAPATNLFETIINKALQLRVSDIHLNPLEKNGEIKFRIDGLLRKMNSVNSSVFSELITILKVMAHLDIAERRTPHDGNINTTVSGEDISMRISTMPTIYGEKITLRILAKEQNGVLSELSDLGMNKQHMTQFKDALNSPHGIILLSGPTGSGKTTTLYAALRYLRQNENRHLVSIEDPVEVPVSGVTQIPVDSDKDRLSFAKALRGVLRHDPDVIMVGEIRDPETANIAVKAALTGHLVIATLHANTSVGIISRMTDLGVSPYLLASTLRLAIAQRLVRQPCTHCMTLEPPTDQQIKALNIIEDTAQTFPIAKGCPLCGGSGSSGRIGLYELISPDSTIRKMIRSEKDEEDIANYIFNTAKVPNLLDDGLTKAKEAKLTIKELIRTTIS